MKRFISLLMLLFIFFCSKAQPYSKDVLYEARQHLYKSTVDRSIIINLQHPLNLQSENRWQEAMSAMLLLNYETKFTQEKITQAIKSWDSTSSFFQQALVTYLYEEGSSYLTNTLARRIDSITDEKLFSLAVTYLYKNDSSSREHLKILTEKRITEQPTVQRLQMMYDYLFGAGVRKPDLQKLFDSSFLPGKVIVYSLQRYNRNYPGMVIVRDTAGRFVMQGDSIFNVPQLARSMSNLPYYFSGGNTPQGIFRMTGFDVSKLNFIGPTLNVQLTMPYEFYPRRFFSNETLPKEEWNIRDYKNLLPVDLQNYLPLFETWNAGKLGRTAIISHGSTINPAYYLDKPFYPLTPSEGCLSTTEIWDEKKGTTRLSHQQELDAAIYEAGGANGYLIMIEIDDRNAPVMLREIQPYLLP